MPGQLHIPDSLVVCGVRLTVPFAAPRLAVGWLSSPHSEHTSRAAGALRYRRSIVEPLDVSCGWYGQVEGLCPACILGKRHLERVRLGLDKKPRASIRPAMQLDTFSHRSPRKPDRAVVLTGFDRSGFIGYSVVSTPTLCALPGGCQVMIFGRPRGLPVG